MGNQERTDNAEATPVTIVIRRKLLHFKLWLTTVVGGLSSQSILLVMVLSLSLVALFNDMGDPGLVSSEISSEMQVTTRDNSIHQYRTAAKQCPKISLEDQTLAPLFKSQDGEDKELLQWFNGLCGGTYMEMGGLDGVTYSNTYVFNQSPLNWTGVLVEVNPKTFPTLEKNRPHELANVHAAVCDVKQIVHYVNLNNRPAGGIWEFAAPSFRAQRWGGMTVDKATPVECLPLRDILKQHVGEPFYFDFFSLDIEGAELAALRSLDFTQVAFGILVVESDEHNARKNLALRMFLEENGYTFLYEKTRSYWFVNRDFGSIYKDVLHE